MLFFLALLNFLPFSFWEELPGLSSNLSRELFPRVETLPSFFSPLSPLPPFISVKWLPGGKLSSAAVCVRWARGRPAKNIAPLPAPSIHLLSSPVLSHHPIHTLHLCASWGRWQSPKPISEEFPCLNLYQFQRLQVLSTACEKLKLPSLL